MSINLKRFIPACTCRRAYMRLHIFSLTAHVQAWGSVEKLRVRGRGAHRSISCGCHLSRFLVCCLRLPSTRFCGILSTFTYIFICTYILICTANPTSGVTFSKALSKLKDQSSNVPFATFQCEKAFELSVLTYEREFENDT